ncbi:hypothetical protein SAMN06265350_103289 [Solitalea koreensis]|uniref:Uncharacterized protein n=1 Tax=Solitalea koreensis TaxID=543615 RepID=A0A521C802_9SPHI|nr:hypothetical protein SAMN06265350_103289 [Solitalea koreensis]
MLYEVFTEFRGIFNSIAALYFYGSMLSIEIKLHKMSFLLTLYWFR